MEQSLLYNLLSFGIIDKWRKAEEAENARFKKREQELAEQLKEELTEKGKDLLTCYYLEIENRGRRSVLQRRHKNFEFRHTDRYAAKSGFSRI